MLAQRIYGLALGYEDFNDQEQLRCDPLMGLLSGKRDLGPTAGRQEHAEPTGVDRAQRALSQDQVTRQEAFDQLLVELYLESHSAAARSRSCSIWMLRISRSTAISRSASSMAIITATAIYPCISSPVISCCARGSGRPIKMRRPVRWRKWSRIVTQLRAALARR